MGRINFFPFFNKWKLVNGVRAAREPSVRAEFIQIKHIAQFFTQFFVYFYE
jgi:hypothetical protein